MVKKSILIVDDSPVILDRLGKMLLRTNVECDVLTADSYSQALAILAERPFHIAMLDIHLEDRNGIDLLKVIRIQYPEMLVIMITNQASEQVKTQCMELGAAFFLDKSKDFTKIPQIISSIIQ